MPTQDVNRNNITYSILSETYDNKVILRSKEPPGNTQGKGSGGTMKGKVLLRMETEENPIATSTDPSSSKQRKQGILNAGER